MNRLLHNEMELIFSHYAADKQNNKLKTRSIHTSEKYTIQGIRIKAYII